MDEPYEEMILLKFVLVFVHIRTGEIPVFFLAHSISSPPTLLVRSCFFL